MEKPNMSYIESLSGGDKEFEKKLLIIIKKEFPEEKEIYFKNVKLNKHKKIAENVHKLKHKISILGLEKGYKIAANYENNLLAGNTKLQKEFESILTTITNYLK